MYSHKTSTCFYVPPTASEHTGHMDLCRQNPLKQAAVPIQAAKCTEV